MPTHRQPGFGLQRAYEATDDRGGYRVLVDRLWPRGVKKEDASLDEWIKDVAPSVELRRWYGHDPTRFEEFARRYREELSRPPGSDAVAHLRGLAGEQHVVLVTATRDVDHSGARVLRDHLREHHH
jgi:uncharacterized protein YeaO (DUF488 family)